MTTLVEARRQPSLRFVFSHPAHFIAFGFGSGLSPVAPGTIGTILGFPIYYALARVMPDLALIVCIGLFIAIGVWVCDITGRHLGVHDHGGMVWDEIAAIMLVLYFVPAKLTWQISAFVLFRVFDILKPVPIRSLDRGIRNGFGVMLDDIVAAFYVLLCLAAWVRIENWVTEIW